MPSSTRRSSASDTRGHGPLSPEAALRLLLAGNQRFAANRMLSVEQDLTILKERAVEKQEPFAAILSCADSRVPVELVFDQTIGQIFVARVAGNVITPEIIASLEYGVAILGVKVLLVLGHTACGAVTAAVNGLAAPGQISILYKRLQPAVKQSGGDIGRAVQANAELQANLLMTASVVVRDAARSGTLLVESGVYDLSTGKVTLTRDLASPPARPR